MNDMVCISPIDGKELVRRPAATAQEIDGAIAAARAAQKEWRRLSIAERSAYVLKFLDAMHLSHSAHNHVNGGGLVLEKPGELFP